MIKHYVITRFLCVNFNHTNEELFSKEWLDRAYQLTTTHFLPTLKNQENQNFEIILLIHDEIPYEKVKMLYELKSATPIHIIRFSDLQDFLNREKNKFDILITSRLDYDDNIHKSVVGDIQDYAISNPQNITVYGLNKGATIIEGESIPFLREEKKYEKTNEGYWSAMETLILPTSTVDNLFSIYSLGDHTSVVVTLKKKWRDMGIKSLNPNFFYKDRSEEIKYLWVRHKNSQTVMTKNIWHTTNKKVNIDLENDFAYIF